MAGYMNIDGGLVRNGGRQRYPQMSQINVTPFVDVMLVLLVIFMITAPLLTVGVPVNLPQTNAPPLTKPDEPLEVTVNAEGEVFLQNTMVELDALVPRLIAITQSNPETPIYIRGDTIIDYGRVSEVIALIKAAGFNKLGLIHAPPGRLRK